VLSQDTLIQNTDNIHHNINNNNHNNTNHNTPHNNDNNNNDNNNDNNKIGIPIWKDIDQQYCARGNDYSPIRTNCGGSVQEHRHDPLDYRRELKDMTKMLGMLHKRIDMLFEKKI